MGSSGGLQKLVLVLLIVSFIVPEIYGGVVLQSAIINNNNNTNNYINNNNQREFDYFVLALQWPATFCRKTRHCCSSNACCRGSNAPTEFTIHGLWPDYNDGSWPSCCTSSSFDMKEVSTLLDPLQKYWPSLSCGSPSTCHGKKGVFWAHEWEKHGTCSSPVVHNEYEYFLTTLNVYFKHNVTKVLNDAGYVASNSEKYPLGGIITEIQNAFHATPLLACSNGAVQELKLCFYKDFTPRDCVTSSSTQDDKLYSKSSCPKYVSLPETASLGKNLPCPTNQSRLEGKSSKTPVSGLCNLWATFFGHENVEDAYSWLAHSAAL